MHRQQKFLRQPRDWQRPFTRLRWEKAIAFEFHEARFRLSSYAFCLQSYFHRLRDDHLRRPFRFLTHSSRLMLFLNSHTDS
jgi:hypothetical protein